MAAKFYAVAVGRRTGMPTTLDATVLKMVTRTIELWFSGLRTHVQRWRFYSLLSGVYRTWDECKAQVHQFPAAIHKAFKSNGEAAAFIDKHGQSRGFACSGGAQATEAVVPARAAKRRRKAAKVAAATPAALQEPPSDENVSGAQPEHAAPVCADADTAAGSAADDAAMPTIWSSMLYRLVRIDTR
jgi:Caulimovirus viroplasmin